jgi:hypothetical protein
MAEIPGYNRNKFARAEQGRQFVSQLGALAVRERPPTNSLLVLSN